MISVSWRITFLRERRVRTGRNVIRGCEPLAPLRLWSSEGERRSAFGHCERRSTGRRRGRPSVTPKGRKAGRPASRSTRDPQRRKANDDSYPAPERTFQQVTTCHLNKSAFQPPKLGDLLEGPGTYIYCNILSKENMHTPQNPRIQE